MRFLSTAIDLCWFGWHVIPLQPGSKRPIPGSHGSRDASNDEDTIADWADAYPDANIGVVCGPISGLVVLDVDPRNGGDETMRTLVAEHGPLPYTTCALTRSGGYHSYFSAEGVPANCRKSRGGIDVQWDGKFVVAPPSIIRPDCVDDGIGGIYEWVEEPMETLPPVPSWIWGFLARETPRPAPIIDLSQHPSPEKLGYLVQRVLSAVPGERNNVIYWASRRAEEESARGLYSAAEAHTLLLRAARAIGYPSASAEAALRYLNRRSH